MIKKFVLYLCIFLMSCTSNKILKHPLDKSESKTLMLDNGLKVYLLSDPSFNVSAASVSVEVGSLAPVATFKKPLLSRMFLRSSDDRNVSKS